MFKTTYDEKILLYIDLLRKTMEANFEHFVYSVNGIKRQYIKNLKSLNSNEIKYLLSLSNIETITREDVSQFRDQIKKLSENEMLFSSMCRYFKNQETLQKCRGAFRNFARDAFSAS